MISKVKVSHVNLASGHRSSVTLVLARYPLPTMTMLCVLQVEPRPGPVHFETNGRLPNGGVAEPPPNTRYPQLQIICLKLKMLIWINFAWSRKIEKVTQLMTD